jgi:hypothetical protein
MDQEMINLTLLNISGMLEKINNALSNETSNYIAISSSIIAGIGCVIAGGSSWYSWKSQKDNFFKNTFDTLISQFRIELSQVNKDELRKDLLECIKNVYQPKSKIDFNRTNLIDDSKYVNCFVLVYRILKVIDKESINNKGYYIGIIRAIIPNDMLWLLALNSLQTDEESKLIFKRYRELLKKYNIFKHIKKIKPNTELNKYVLYKHKDVSYACYIEDPFADILYKFKQDNKK